MRQHFSVLLLSVGVEVESEIEVRRYQNINSLTMSAVSMLFPVFWRDHDFEHDAPEMKNRKANTFLLASERIQLFL